MKESAQLLAQTAFKSLGSLLTSVSYGSVTPYNSSTHHNATTGVVSQLTATTETIDVIFLNNDETVLFPALDLSVTPKVEDIIVRLPEDVFRVNVVSFDPAEASYKLDIVSMSVPELLEDIAWPEADVLWPEEDEEWGSE